MRRYTDLMPEIQSITFYGNDEVQITWNDTIIEGKEKMKGVHEALQEYFKYPDHDSISEHISNPLKRRIGIFVPCYDFIRIKRSLKGYFHHSTRVNGLFEDQEDEDRYQAILEGGDSVELYSVDDSLPELNSLRKFLIGKRFTDIYILGPLHYYYITGTMGEIRSSSIAPSRIYYEEDTKGLMYSKDSDIRDSYWDNLFLYAKSLASKGFEERLEEAKRYEEVDE